MPTSVRILGVDIEDLLEGELENLKKWIASVFAGIPELGIPPTDVVVFTAPNDLSVFKRQKKIVAYVEDLVDSPKRTLEIRSLLARNIGLIIEQWIRQCKVKRPLEWVQVQVKRIDPDGGGEYIGNLMP